jgi:hypothetical protein
LSPWRIAHRCSGGRWWFLNSGPRRHPMHVARWNLTPPTHTNLSPRAGFTPQPAGRRAPTAGPMSCWLVGAMTQHGKRVWTSLQSSRAAVCAAEGDTRQLGLRLNPNVTRFLFSLTILPQLTICEVKCTDGPLGSAGHTVRRCGRSTTHVSARAESPTSVLEARVSSRPTSTGRARSATPSTQAHASAARLRCV